MSKKVLLLSIMISIFLISVVSATMDYAASANGGVVSYSIDDIGYANGVPEGNIGNVNDGNSATYFGVKAQYPDRRAWSQFSATIMFSQTVPEISQIDWVKDLRIVYGFDEAYYICNLYVLQGENWNSIGSCYAPGYSSPGSLTGNWKNVDGVKASLTARVGGESRFGGAYTYARLYELKAFGKEISEPVCGNDILETGEQCDDGNLDDFDGCSSTCMIEYFECCYDEDCLDDYYSENYCKDEDVYQDYHDFFCEDNECFEDVFSELVKECDYDCVNGECIDEPEEPECYFNSDCGINHCLGGANYCLDNDVYQDFIVYTCNNPGQVDAYCSNGEFPWLLEECDYMCDNGECIDEPEPPVNVCGDNVLNMGVEECDDGNLIDGDGCSSICEIEEPVPPECCDDEDCNDDYYEDKYCYVGDVYRDFHDFFCENGECKEDIISELFDKCDSDEDCENGECVEEDDDDDDDDHDSTCNDRELYNNCNLDQEVEDVLVVYESLKDDVKIINNDIPLINKSQEKIIDNSWVLYLFLGIGVLIVLILISLGVKR